MNKLVTGMLFLVVLAVIAVVSSPIRTCLASFQGIGDEARGWSFEFSSPADVENDGLQEQFDTEFALSDPVTGAQRMFRVEWYTDWALSKKQFSQLIYDATCRYEELSVTSTIEIEQVISDELRMAGLYPVKVEELLSVDADNTGEQLDLDRSAEFLAQQLNADRAELVHALKEVKELSAEYREQVNRLKEAKLEGQSRTAAAPAPAPVPPPAQVTYQLPVNRCVSAPVTSCWEYSGTPCKTYTRCVQPRSGRQFRLFPIFRWRCR